MESSKHNDELIKRKLADLSAEPRKLKFAEVHANYEAARKASSSRKWGLYLIFGTIGIASIIGASLFLTPGKSNDLAQNNVAQEYSTTQNSIQSVGTTFEDKFVERSDDKTTNSNADQTNVAKTNETTNTANEELTKNTESKTNDASAKETSLEKIQPKAEKNDNSSANSTTKKEIENSVSSKSNVSSNSVTEKKSTVKKKEVSTSAAQNKKESSTTENSTANKSNTGNTEKENSYIANKSNRKKISGSVNKIDTKKQIQAGSDADQKVTTDQTKNAKDPATDPKTENKNNELTKAGDPAKNDAQGNSNNTGTDEMLNTQSVAAASSTVEELREPDAKSDKTKAEEGEGKDPASLETIKVDSAVANNHIPNVIGTGSVSPRNKHKIFFNLEATYATVFYNAKANPNAPAMFTTGDPAFNTIYANAVGKGKHSLFTGGASLSYVYNESIGINAGVSYFNLKTTVDVPAKSTPTYTTAIDYYVWAYVTDSSQNPPTLNLQIVDTIYKQVQNGNVTSNATVNGDSTGTAKYENKIQYLSIPINLSYNFKIGAKFTIEPQAGVVYTMPLRSSHMVATDAYKFDYAKEKADLRKNLYFNVGLKLGYNINNRMQLYIREGYFFRNQSVYNANQPVSMALKSLYTSFGIAIRLK